MDNKYTYKDKDGNDRNYAFGVIPALEAIKVEIAVAKVIGEPLFKAFVGKDKADAADKEAATVAGGAAIGLILSKMDANELTATMETVFQYVSIDGKRIDINTTFTGRNKELWAVFIQALRFNFRDFLPEGLLTSVQESLVK